MKLSTLILAGLMTVSSATVFAEGGAERIRQHWDNFKLSQQHVHGKADSMASVDTVKTAPANDYQVVKEQQPST
ncbi:hypothetical protein [Pseudomonas fluorescens]|uniref:Secreted protein n=1 Tax=Pseudomonas fluorescens TaxID=294 RepID=A0A5E7BJH8_PSEFL|nr:hypothetical protein [Pseudomonas fluorescens]VVN89607.1 hypothetical protein PS691_01758 [Pseudomonas fluorescens]